MFIWNHQIFFRLFLIHIRCGPESLKCSSILHDKWCKGAVNAKLQQKCNPQEALLCPACLTVLIVAPASAGIPNYNAGLTATLRRCYL